MNIQDITSAPLDEVQARILAGETFTVEEYQAVIARYRGERRAASETSAKSRSKKASPVANFDLNADLDAFFNAKGV